MYTHPWPYQDSWCTTVQYVQYVASRQRAADGREFYPNTVWTDSNRRDISHHRISEVGCGRVSKQQGDVGELSITHPFGICLTAVFPAAWAGSRVDRWQMIGVKSTQQFHKLIRGHNAGETVQYVLLNSLTSRLEMAAAHDSKNSNR